MNHKNKNKILLISFSVLTATLISLIAPFAQNSQITQAQSNSVSYQHSSIPSITPEINREIIGYDIDSDRYSNVIYAWMELENSTVYYYYQRFSADGVPIDANKQSLSQTGTGYTSTSTPQVKVAMGSNGQYVIMAKVPQSSVYLYGFNYDGQQTRTYTGLGNQPSSNWDLEIKKNDPLTATSFVVVSENADQQQISGYTFQGDFTTSGTFTTISLAFDIQPLDTGTTHTKPKVSISSDYAIATWSRVAGPSDKTIWYRAFELDATPNSNSNFTPTQLTQTDNITDNPVVSSIYRNDNSTNNFLIAWDGEGNGDDQGIYLAKINCGTSGCIKIGVDARANTVTTGNQTYPSIAAATHPNTTLRLSTDENSANDYFVINWVDESTSSKAVYAQNFQGNLGRKNNYYIISDAIDIDTTKHEKLPIVTANQDGETTFALIEELGSKIEGYQYKGEYLKSGNYFLTHQPDTFYEFNSRIDRHINGNFVVVWQENSDSTVDEDIFFGLYDSYGNPIKGKTKIAGTDLGNQNYPDVAFFKDDPARFIITYIDQNNLAKYALYDADGTSIASDQQFASDPVQIHELVVDAGLYPTAVAAWLEDDSGQIHPKYNFMKNAIPANYDNFLGDLSTSFTRDLESLIPDIAVTINPSATSTDDNTLQFVAAWRTGAQILDPGINLIEGYWQSNAITLPWSVQTISNAESFDLDGTLPASTFNFLAAFQTDNGTDNGVSLNTYDFSSSTTPSATASITDLITTQNNSFDSTTEEYDVIKVAADHNTADILISWARVTSTSLAYTGGSSTAADQLRTEGQYFQFDGSGYSAFGPIFNIINLPINNTFQSDLAYLTNPSNPETNYAISTATTYGNTEVEDSFGTYLQTLEDPFTLTSEPVLNPLTKQTITAGGKVLIVPSDIDFGNLAVGSEDSFQTVTVEIIDKDGSPFDLTISSSTIENITTPASPDIPLTNFYVRNRQYPSGDPLNVQAGTTFEFTDLTDIDLQSVISDTFINLTSTRTLAQKNSYNTGHWIITPRFLIDIPNTVDNGNYAATVTFTLI